MNIILFGVSLYLSILFPVQVLNNLVNIGQSKENMSDEEIEKKAKSLVATIFILVASWTAFYAVTH